MVILICNHVNVRKILQHTIEIILDFLLTITGIVTTLKEFDEFDKSEPLLENLTDKEIIKITSFEEEEEKKEEMKPRKTRAAHARNARNLLLQQKKALGELVKDDYQSEWAELDITDRNKVIEKRMESRLQIIGKEAEKAV